MSLLAQFLDPTVVSLKICGVTAPEDAHRLAELGVAALGVNFWPQSRRYVAPAGADWLRDLEGRILRVGVFVNESPEQAVSLLEDGLIDAIQLHGDETPEGAGFYRRSGVPFFKAVGVKSADDLEGIPRFGASAVLLDAHAPGVYGGTGETFDWNDAVAFKQRHPGVAVILAGGIVPANVARAVAVVRPAAVDVASGAELAPGRKDFTKVAALIEGLSC